MSYHLEIVRESRGNDAPLTKDEFCRACECFAELDLCADGMSADLIYDNDCIATLTLADGRIWTRYNEEEVLRVMLKVANVLHARVIGETGIVFTQAIY